MGLSDWEIFLKWNLIFALAFYLISVFSAIFLKKFLIAIHQKWFQIPQETLNIAIYGYLGIFKIMLILFFVVPYLALLVAL